ncbi:hypothetical protein AGMMS50262_14340 [Bacteroidia bacterium]|nr:hypothetical protein AGMMS50262_14340 [Bacteroidia bacterium]
MITKTMTDKSTRFDTRLPKEQKLYFEKAVQLGGYRSLTEFFISTALEKAKKIISEREQIIASQRDSEIFFNALLNQNKPNDYLIEAANEYKHRLNT